MGALTAVLALAGCSSSPPPAYQPPQGALIPGTAQVTVDGRDAGTTDSVRCDTVGSLTMISTGDAESPDGPGVSAMVSNADGLVARLIGITDLGGFTGSYAQNLQGEANVTMTDRTYDIDGVVAGFAADNPSFRATTPFRIKIAC